MFFLKMKYIYIPKTITAYLLKKAQNNYLMFISNINGWGIQKLSSTTLNYFKSLESYLLNIFLGYLKPFFVFLKIKGMGFKSIYFKNGLIFKLGFRHRIVLVIPYDIRLVYLTKHKLQIVNRLYSNLVNLEYGISNLRKKNSYKKKGILRKGIVVVLKLTRKKSQY